ncbi:hypothetical protein JCM33374_g2187 [Metschnikowia sp. JCM 33374]|nr:hypothetical protein JCM33374_g2187 [Metschnikowia sp. JCM 33374]
MFPPGIIKNQKIIKNENVDSGFQNSTDFCQTWQGNEGKSQRDGLSKSTHNHEVPSPQVSKEEGGLPAGKRRKTGVSSPATTSYKAPTVSNILIDAKSKIHQGDHSITSSHDHTHNKHTHNENILNLAPIEKISQWGVIVYACPLCPRECVSPSALITHLRTHTGEKPFQCTICQKKLSSERILAMHMRTHTGEKPYQCEVCGKRMCSKGSLSIHLATHKGETYPCSICQKKLSTKQVLARHMKTHQGEKRRSSSGKEVLTPKALSDKKSPGEKSPDEKSPGEKSPGEKSPDEKSPGENSLGKTPRGPKLPGADSLLGVFSAVPEGKIQSHLNETCLTPTSPLNVFQGAPTQANINCSLKDADQESKFHLEQQIHAHPGQRNGESYHYSIPTSQPVLGTQPGYNPSAYPPETYIKGGFNPVVHYTGEANLQRYPNWGYYPDPTFVRAPYMLPSAESLTEHTRSHPGEDQKGHMKPQSEKKYTSTYHPAKVSPEQSVPPYTSPPVTRHYSQFPANAEKVSPANVSPESIPENFPETPNKQDGPYNCPVCPRKATSLANLDIHMKIHLGEKPFACPICHKKLSSKPNLKIHLRTHTGEKPFQCHICHKRLSSKNSLNLHLGTHKGEKPYECIICQRSLSSKQRLITHLATHINDKNECAICKDTLASKKDLIDHLVTHSEERFQCKVCSKKFSTEQVLTRHMESHVEDKYYCSICHNRLSSKRALARMNGGMFKCCERATVVWKAPRREDDVDVIYYLVYMESNGTMIIIEDC